jgi:hypothetical protein
VDSGTTYRSHARSMTPFPLKSSPARTLPPSRRGVPIKLNHLYMKMLAAKVTM